MINKQDHSINISPVLKGKIELIKETAYEKDIHISTDITKDAPVTISSHTLDRIMDILLHNAITHNQPGGHILICLKREKRVISMIIRTIGPGIPTGNMKQRLIHQHQNRISKETIPSHSRGLPWVKKKLAEISGTLTMRSDVNKETDVTITFTPSDTKKEKKFRFLEQDGPPGERGHASLKEGAWKENKATVLVIEKNPELIQFMQEKMEEYFHFFYIQDFTHIKQQLQKIPEPDVVLINMIKRDYDLCGSVSELKEYHNSMFIYYAHKTTKQDLLKGFRYGRAVDFIEEPFSIEVLIAKIRSLLHYRDINLLRKMEEVEESIYRFILKRRKGSDQWNKKIENYNFTQHEKEVILSLIDGLDNQEIAEKIKIPIDDVEKHIHTILKKYNLHTRSQIVKFFLS